MIMFKFLNIFFLVFHSLFTLFNITGWIFKKTRRVHLFTIIATAVSWFLLGIWYGYGYCFLTDWHFAVREKLGYMNISYSYIHFLIYEFSGINLDPVFVDMWVLRVFLASTALSIYFNAKDFLSKKGYSSRK